jgi:SNF2 family DNA or RNA helicase
MTKYVTGGPPRFMHQRRGLDKMIRTGGVTALLFDPGLGKTAVVLDYAGLLALKSPRGEAKVLVVCPLAAVDTWVLQANIFMSPMVNWWAEALGGSLLQRAEAMAARGENSYTRLMSDQGRVNKVHPGAPRSLHHEKSWAWAASCPERTVPITQSEGPAGLGSDRPRVVIEVINIDTLQYRTTLGGRTMADVMVDAIKRYGPDLLVVDESHKIKGSSANASRLLGRVSRFVPRRVILTGTVMPHSPLDVFGQWRFLEPYAFGDIQPDGSHRQATFSSFKHRYAIEGGWMGKEITGFKNLDHMQTVMAKNAIVARKEEALDLPPTTDVIVPVELSPAEKKAYKEMKEGLATLLSSGEWASTPNRLAQMMRLRQITSGHLPSDSGATHIIGHSKAAVIKSLVHDTLAGEKRIVIFCLFSREITMLSQMLAAPGTEVMVIEGGVSNEDRQMLRKRFGSDDPQRIVLVAQIKTLSLAVNELITANHAIFASLSQQRDDLIQARDRLDRIGQTRPVTFWYALAPGTVDEVILKAHNDRTSLEDAMLRHIQDQGTL